MRRFLVALLSVFALAMPAKAFVSVTWNGVTYSIPESGDLNWSSLTTFLQAVGNNAAVAKQMKQAVRVATTTPVTVSATADFTIVTNLGTPGAVAVNLPSGIDGQIFIVMDGKGDAATNNVTITPASGTIGGGATLVMDHNSEAVLVQYHASTTDWKILINNLKPGTLKDADISATAAIARTKIANGTADHVLINNGSGTMTSEATLAKVRGGSGQDNSSLTFPASGTLATLAGTEAFTNKTLTQGIIDDWAEFNHESTPATPAAGKIRVYAKSDNNLYRVDPNGVEQKIGSGAASSADTNYITNPSAAADLTGWTLVNSGLALTRTTTAANLPRENTTGTGISILGTAGTEAATDYVYFPMTLDDVDAGAIQRVLQIKWDQKVIGAYTDGLLAVTITDGSNNLLATPVTTAIPASDGTFATTFVTTSTQAVRLKIAATAAIGTGAGIVISNVVVGPGTLVQGAPISDWQSYTPTTQGLGTISSGEFYWSRSGQQIYISGKFTCGTTTASTAYVSLPTGLTIANLSANMAIGKFERNVTTGSSPKQGVVLGAVNTAYVTFAYDDYTNTAAPLTSSSGSSAFSAGEVISFFATIPVQQFSSGVYLGSGADNAVTPLNWTAYTPTVTYDSGSITTHTDTAWQRRDGDSVRYSGNIAISSVGTFSGVIISLPQTVDTSKRTFVAGVTSIGSGTINSSSETTPVIVTYVDSTHARIRWHKSSAAEVFAENIANGTPFGTPVNITWEVSYPVVNWTTQDYLGKMLTGFATAKVGSAGLVNNDSSNTTGTPIKGKTDGSTTTAGYVGEQLRCVVNSSTNVPGSSGSWGNMCSLNLTKGTWDLTGVAVTVNNGATITSLEVGIGSTSNSGAGMVYGDNKIATLMPTATIANNAVIPQYRVEIGADTTYYFEINASYSVATPQFFARFTAVRVN